MLYQEIISGTFIERPNRFLAQVDIEGSTYLVHVKNTGRCKELLVPGVKVFLEKSRNPKRKTQYSLISVYKGNQLINMDSQVPNAVVKEALELGLIQEIGRTSFIKGEVTYADSRFDLYYELEGGTRGFIEVKGVTLEEGGIALFPDAPTARGEKHIRGLMEAKKAGYQVWICFLIQMHQVDLFIPNHKRDPKFSEALKAAEAMGVGIMVYNSRVNRNGIFLDGKIPYRI